MTGTELIGIGEGLVRGLCFALRLGLRVGEGPVLVRGLRGLWNITKVTLTVFLLAYEYQEPFFFYFHGHTF